MKEKYKFTEIEFNLKVDTKFIAAMLYLAAKDSEQEMNLNTRIEGLAIFPLILKIENPDFNLNNDDIEVEKLAIRILLDELSKQAEASINRSIDNINNIAGSKNKSSCKCPCKCKKTASKSKPKARTGSILRAKKPLVVKKKAKK